MENGKAEAKRRKPPQLPSILINKIIIDVVKYSDASKVPNLFFKNDIYYLLLSSYQHIEKLISKRSWYGNVLVNMIATGLSAPTQSGVGIAAAGVGRILESDSFTGEILSDTSVRPTNFG